MVVSFSGFRFSAPMAPRFGREAPTWDWVNPQHSIVPTAIEAPRANWELHNRRVATGKQQQTLIIPTENLEWDTSLLLGSLCAVEKLQISHRLLQAYKLALVYSQTELPTGRHFAAIGEILLADGKTRMVVDALNTQELQQQPICDVKVLNANARKAAEGQDFTFERIFLANAQVKTLDPVPCGECFEFMTTKQFAGNPEIYRLDYDKRKDQLVVHGRKASDWLPYHSDPNLQTRPVANHKGFIQAMHPNISLKASGAMHKYGLTVDELKDLMTDTITAYHQRQQPTLPINEDIKAARVFSGILLQDSQDHQSETVTPSFAFSRRNVIPADQLAVALAFYNAGREGIAQDAKVRAISYYGDYGNKDAQGHYTGLLPSLGTLSFITRYLGSHGEGLNGKRVDDTIIMVVENGQWKIRTAAEYMPEVYEASRNGAEHGISHAA